MNKQVTGIPFNQAWIDEIRINLSAALRRVDTLKSRRTVKKTHQAAWLLKAVSMIDLTTLSGDDTQGRVRRLCLKAANPVRKDILQALGFEQKLTTGAVCVYHEMIAPAVKALEGTGIPVAAVSTGFPAGLSPFKLRLEEIKASVQEGASEIDIVISRRHVLTGNWALLYDELCAFKEACGDAHMKSILAVGQLGSMTKVAKASMTAMMAGSDFIKTSTGMEAVNATLPVSLIMIRMIREFYQRTGQKVGYKPAGGISQAKDALHYLIMIKEELGEGWLNPEYFRFGASSLLNDIERQLEHHVTGRYSASYRHPLA